MYQCDQYGQLMLLEIEPYEETKKPPRPRAAKPDSVLIAVPYYYIDFKDVDLFGNPYWQLRSPWREGKKPLNTGVAPRLLIRASLTEILEPNPDPKYRLTTTACVGILRRAGERGKELPEQLEMALMIQAGLTDAPYTPSELKAYHINQRDEGIDLDGVSGALMATNNMQMQTFVTQGEPPIGFDGYNGDLTGGVSATLGVNCGMSTGRNGVLAPIAFAANQRDEVRDLHDVAGALGAQPGMKQQTFIAEGVVTKGNGECFLTHDQHTSLSTGGGQAGQGYPCVMTAGFSAGAGPNAGGIGWQKECTPTLKAAESGTNMVPSILCLNDQGGERMDITEDQTTTLRAQMGGHQPLICLNDQGGKVMSCTENISGTLRAQEHGHQPIVMDEVMLFENHGIDSRYTGPHTISPTISARAGTGGNNVPLVSQNADTFCITGNAIDRQPFNGGNGIGYQEDLAYTLTATDHHAVFSRQRVDVAGLDCRNAAENGDLCGTLQKGTSGSSLNSIHPIRCGILIRRLTPLECERLQGFPDLWTKIDSASDSARYKALGNSVAIPCVEFIMEGIEVVATYD